MEKIKRRESSKLAKVNCSWMSSSFTVPTIFTLSSFPAPPNSKIIHHYHSLAPTNKPPLYSAILHVSLHTVQRKVHKKDTRFQNQQKITDILRGGQKKSAPVGSSFGRVKEINFLESAATVFLHQRSTELLYSD